MCRYAGKNYKSHYVCFKCRKSFKQVDFYDIYSRISKNNDISFLSKKEGNNGKLKLLEELENRSVKCPECGNLMADLGREFKAPKKTAVKKWNIIEGLYRIGKVFHTCGCYGIGYVPQNPKDYEVYLRNMMGEYEESLTACQEKTHAELPDKMGRINYWAKQISIINQEMIHQKFNN